MPLFLITVSLFFDNMNDFDTTLWRKSDWANGKEFMCGWSPSHITHNTGIMTITLDNQMSHGCYYASGEYMSKKLYGYGCIMGRIKFSCRESGTCASLFTYTSSEDGNPLSEIDIEILARAPTWLWCSLHYASGDYTDTVQLGFDASQGFHTYGFQWTQDTVKWLVDSQVVTYS